MPYTIPQPVREQTTPYVVFKDFLSPEECRWVIELHAEIAPQKAQVEGGIDSEKRRAEVYWLDWNGTPERNTLFGKLADAVGSANAKWWGYHLAGFNEPLQLTHYRAEDKGHYDWHEDHGDRGNFLYRKLSCVLPLQAAEEGGEFELYGVGKPPEMAAGTLILFPSFRLHRVLPVTKGERWSLVAWVNGPPFV